MIILIVIVNLSSILALAYDGRIIGGEEAGMKDAPWQVPILVLVITLHVIY